MLSKKCDRLTTDEKIASNPTSAYLKKVVDSLVAKADSKNPTLRMVLAQVGKFMVVVSEDEGFRNGVKNVLRKICDERTEWDK